MVQDYFSDLEKVVNKKIKKERKMRLRDHKRPYKHEDAYQSGGMDHGKIL